MSPYIFPKLLSPKYQALISRETNPVLLSSDIRSDEVERAFRDLLESAWFDIVLEGIFFGFSNSPLHVDGNFDVESGFILTTPDRSLTFRLYSRTPEMIYSTPHEGWLGVRGKDALSVTEYEVLDGGSRIVPGTVRKQLSHGDQCFLHGGNLTYDYAIDGEVVGIRLLSVSSDRVLSMYDRKSLRRVSYVGYASYDSEIAMAIRCLVEADSVEHTEIILKALGHPAHFVRWEAAKAVARLQPDMAPEILQKLVNDAHPEVRQAASRSLTKISAA